MCIESALNNRKEFAHTRPGLMLVPLVPGGAEVDDVKLVCVLISHCHTVSTQCRLNNAQE